jgi:hypothetical protein
VSRIPKYVRGNAFEWYGEMYDLGLIYHPEDAPEEIELDMHPDSNPKTFTPEECKELRVIMELIDFDTKGDRCEPAYLVAVARGDILEN